MNILETIASQKRLEVESSKKLVTLATLERSPYFGRQAISMAEALLRPGASGIIAEFKRQSPSKGVINPEAVVEVVTAGYIAAGASALSVLTDNRFFGGRNEDVVRARKANACPILRKEFIIDPYQVVEAKAMGADAILLIAAILTPGETLELATIARSLGLETILEVHGLEELGHLNDMISILGVNNRNLADFKVSLEISIDLAGFIPAGKTAISESGIREPADLLRLKQAGYKGFLIGEQFMSTSHPEAACAEFIKKINLSY